MVGVGNKWATYKLPKCCPKYRRGRCLSGNRIESNVTQHDKKLDFVKLESHLLNRCFKAFLNWANPKSCPKSCPLKQDLQATIYTTPYLPTCYTQMGDTGFEPVTSAV